MGLRNQPEFETETEVETQTTTETAKETNMNTSTKTVDAGVAASTAIATASATSSTAVAAARPATKLQLAFVDKQAVFDVSTVEGLALALPRVKGEQGSLFAGDKELGENIHFEIVSTSPRWVIGIGEDTKEAKDFFRVSYDGETISGDTISISAYVESLKAQGFDKTNVSPYLDIFGFVTWAEKGGEIEPEKRELSCLQCSKTSMGNFTAFATTRGLLESRGLAKPIDVVQVTAMKRVSGSNKYTNFAFSAPK